MSLENLLDNGQAETVTSSFARAGDVHPVEALENVGQIGGGNANAIVFNLQENAVGVGHYSQVNRPVGGGVFESVIQQVGDRLLQQLRIALNGNGGIRQLGEELAGLLDGPGGIVLN